MDATLLERWLRARSRSSSRSSVPAKAGANVAKIRLPLNTVITCVSELSEPDRVSSTSTVPQEVPSLIHSSRPWSGSLAEKKIRPSTGVRLRG